MEGVSSRFVAGVNEAVPAMRARFPAVPRTATAASLGIQGNLL
jgi:hypothetical protein